MGEWRAARPGRVSGALGVPVLICASIFTRTSSAAEPTIANRPPEDLDRVARAAREAGRLDDARTAWQAIVSRSPASSIWEAAAMSLGELLRRQDRCDEAIPILQQLITRQGAAGRRPHRDGDSRRWAQWNIGLCKLAGRDYPGALAAFREARRFPIGADCGNTLREWEYRQSLYEGLALEHVGRAPESVRYYAHAARYSADGGRAAGDRLYDLYAASGQLADLRRIAEGNAQHHAITDVVDRLRVIDLEQSRTWADLINDLRGTRNRSRRLALEALARHGDDTVPLLLAEVDRNTAARRSAGYWLWLTIGRAATPKTVAVIVRRARNGPAPPDVAALIEGLRRAGPPGRTALAELAKDPNEQLRKLLNGKPVDDDDAKRENVTFPPVPTNLRLPTSVTEPPPLETPRPPSADLD